MIAACPPFTTTATSTAHHSSKKFQTTATQTTPRQQTYLSTSNSAGSTSATTKSTSSSSLKSGSTTKSTKSTSSLTTKPTTSTTTSTSSSSMEVSDTPWESNDSMLPIFNKPRFVRKSLEASNNKSEFETLWNRLATLEAWRATYPANVPQDLANEDKDLIRQSSTKSRLQRRCNHVRILVNQQLPTPPPTPYKLQVKKSQVDGLGLYTTEDIPEGGTVAYYYGHLHSSTSILLQGNKDYVFELSSSSDDQNNNKLLVDAAHLISMQARYMNDALCLSGNNCKLLAQPNEFRFAILALRNISAGEELFCSYGTTFWEKRAPGRVFSSTSTTSLQQKQKEGEGEKA
eukprot:CAMPEP_0194041742 /NCGR_PEP_ID=MMETSP0009_2-20130614/13591_1 /TAXON_ID=210454 /ORGANISM="Grammatophora oceanica, Strain CCMP 410" /LENGTH=344 /DNA_ID=CAMNT_0038685345 /DNA_START=263 /DNA_END=1297 /DNA_ORIENTATION=+